jgi:hypothetical protein
METKYKVIGIGLVLILAMGIGVFVYQYTRIGNRTGTPPSIPPSGETVPTDTMQYASNSESTKTMPSYQDTKMKEVAVDAQISSFRVKWEMKGVQYYRNVKISNKIQASDNETDSRPRKLTLNSPAWYKIKEVTVPDKIDKARIQFDINPGLSAEVELRVNGETLKKIGKFSDKESFTKDYFNLNIEAGDKVQLFVKTDTLLFLYWSSVDVSNFQIKYEVIERTSKPDVNYQIRINGEPQIQWKIANSKNYEQLDEDIHSSSLLENCTISLWTMAAQGVQVSAKNMEICYDLR